MDITHRDGKKSLTIDISKFRYIAHPISIPRYIDHYFIDTSIYIGTFFLILKKVKGKRLAHR